MSAFDGEGPSVARSAITVGASVEPGHDVNQDERREGDQANRIADGPAEYQFRILRYQRRSFPSER
jgi:hypothetical protein